MDDAQNIDFNVAVKLISDIPHLISRINFFVRYPETAQYYYVFSLQVADKHLYVVCGDN